MFPLSSAKFVFRDLVFMHFEIECEVNLRPIKIVFNNLTRIVNYLLLVCAMADGVSNVMF